MQPRWYTGATRGQWLALAAALLGWAFDGFEQGVFPLVARPALIELQGLSEQARVLKESEKGSAAYEDAKKAVDEPVRKWNAVLTASFLFGAALGGLTFGWLGDRIGRVRAMVFSVLFYALFTGVCGFAQAPWQLAALRFLAAMGMGGEWALGVALVMEKWSPHARPVLAGLIGAAANVGFLAISLLGLALTPAGYWRVFLMICAFPALLTFLLRMFVPESEKWEAAVAKAPAPGFGAIFRPGLRHRSLLGAGLGAVALLATWGAVLTIPPWVGQMTKAPDAPSYALMTSACGAVLGTILAAVLGHRLPRRVGYFGLCLLSFVTCEILFLTPWTYGAPFLAVVFLVGACSAAFYGFLPLYLPELFPTRVRASGQGFCYNFGRSLAAVGVLVIYFGLDLKGEYAQTGAVIVLVYLVGMVLVWFVPETRDSPFPSRPGDRARWANRRRECDEKSLVDAAGSWFICFATVLSSDTECRSLPTARKRGDAVRQEYNVLALIKGEEHYVFVYDDVSRPALLELFRKQAADTALSFNWFDAAVLTEKAWEQARAGEGPAPPRRS